jgi:hypothetical protein
MLNEKKPTEVIAEKPAEPIDLSHLGGKQIGGSFVPDESKQIDLSHLYGGQGRLVVAPPAPEQPKDGID